MKYEKIWAILIALVILIISNLPIFYFYINGKENLFFLGRRVNEYQNTYPYLSFIEQAKNNRPLSENLYNDSQVPLLYSPSYFLIGKAAAVFNLSSITAYHIARIIFSIIFFFILYIFLFKFFVEPKQRLFAFILILISSGLSFISSIIPYPSYTLIESNTFLILTASPHLIVSLILLISGFLFLLKFIEKRKNKHILISFIFFWLLTFEYPFILPIVILTLFFTSFFSGLSFWKSLILTLSSSLVLIYQMLVNYNNLIIKFLSAQNPYLSPSPIVYISIFGFLLFFALFGLEKIIVQKKPTVKLITIWIFSNIVFLYAPVNFQTKMAEGIHIPISILAVFGIFSLYKKIKKGWSGIVIHIFLVIISLSSIFLIINDFNQIGKDSYRSYYYFISKAERESLGWLNKNSDKDAIILSNWFYGNIIPGLTGRKVYLGYKKDNKVFNDKVLMINNFLLDDNLATSVNFLRKNNITYIFLGNNDSMSRYGFKPEIYPFLINVYSKNGVNIYKVKYLK